MNSERIFDELKKLYPDAKCELNFSNDYELVVAVILSAQCTDKRVNLVTPNLFKKYPTFCELSKAKIGDIESLIMSCGLYKSKAKHLLEMSKTVTQKFDGKLPKSLEDLTSLSGVGRKTANVVRATAFNEPAIAVDTHVFRTSNRLGLTKSKDVFSCEKDLMKAFPKEQWRELHYLLVLFGRYLCKAQNPDCTHCPFFSICTTKKHNH